MKLSEAWPQVAGSKVADVQAEICSFPPAAFVVVETILLVAAFGSSDFL